VAILEGGDGVPDVSQVPFVNRVLDEEAAAVLKSLEVKLPLSVEDGEFATLEGPLEAHYPVRLVL